MNKHSLLILTFVLTISACHSSKKAAVEPMSNAEVESYEVKKDSTLPCDHSANIAMDADANCGLLLSMPNGTILQPISFPDTDFIFEDGQNVRVSFLERKSVESDCDKAQIMVELTCLEKDWTFSDAKSDKCEDTIDAFSIGWMKRMLHEVDVEKITKYDYRNEKAYVFEGKKGTLMSDCYGNELCRIRPGERQDCMEIYGQLSNGYVILVVNNN